ncbi:MAG: SLC13 family permease [Myxococcota bacterium]|nr:SLC13 family permease [Myxococcota bacterium]MEC9391793.1 SLC13 family permease [Myxococcota bacterium]
MTPQTSTRLALIGGPALGAALFAVVTAVGLSTDAAWTAAITAVCATWWVTEPIPIPATSIIPFAAFPLTGVLTHKEIATAYGHTLILLLLGGFILSTAMASSGAHKRLAVGMVRLVGGAGGRTLVLGFMLATAVCSMWISNTATTLMLLPVALAVLEQDEAAGGGDTLKVPLLLGIAYAASIGGMGTPVGTPPNVIFMGIYTEATGTEIAFFDWMLIGIPTVAILLPIVWLYLTRNLTQSRDLVLPNLGPWAASERRVLIVFLITAAAWVTRTTPFGGWARWLDLPGAGDSTVALAAVVALFLIPNGKGGRMLDWETASKIPWGLLILFGGGIGIARGFEASGLSTAMGSWLANDLGITAWPVIGMTLTICVAVTFLTEVTSNTATTTLLMPVLAAAGIAAGIDPALLMIPAALSASCAFMLPVATAPNAIMFGTNMIATKTMAREGFALNLVGAVAITAVAATMM